MGIALLPLSAQSNDVLSVTPVSKINVTRGSTVTASLQVKLKPGYHVNSNAPAEDFLIPLKLTWDAKPLNVVAVAFPEPQLEKHDFSKTPMSVYTGDFIIDTKFSIPPDAAPGLGMGAAKLRYQACNDRMCLPPKTVEVKLPFEVR